MAQGLEEDLIAYLDTHVAIWLHAGALEQLSSEARRQIEANDLLISPMVFLEFQYLYDRKRIRVGPAAMQSYLNSMFGIAICDLPFAAAALAATSIDWTADPFDRLIVGHASARHDAPLITADVTIRRHYPRAVW